MSMYRKYSVKPYFDAGQDRTYCEQYHGFTIERNRYGWFNVAAINCWSTPTIESAKRAIDAFALKCGLCEHGVPKTAKEPVCGCPGVSA
jgi:hypothetical protein